ncbi:hypothetical protein L6164_026749 [Bauhinia variegata]|uniref:Uncharacterized protein n=1 Tax=Bauhinia variegata TaxID=167791 RepID=A0ACB9LRC0_BAUVA|nr:hypothetical protein L6164_026749 [Bauhinia variegata]
MSLRDELSKGAFMGIGVLEAFRGEKYLRADRICGGDWWLMVMPRLESSGRKELCHIDSSMGSVASDLEICIIQGILA